MSLHQIITILPNLSRPTSPCLEEGTRIEESKLAAETALFGSDGAHLRLDGQLVNGDSLVTTKILWIERPGDGGANPSSNWVKYELVPQSKSWITQFNFPTNCLTQMMSSTPSTPTTSPVPHLSSSVSISPLAINSSPAEFQCSFHPTGPPIPRRQITSILQPPTKKTGRYAPPLCV